jgi:flagellar basal-body rod modification protein FlgD
MNTEIVSVLIETSGTDRSGNAQRPRQSLGQEDFLTLMVTQLRNQDPMKPLEPNEFLGQLAQFSTVNGIEEMRSSVTDLSVALQGSQVLQGATLVGRSVLAGGQDAALASVGNVDGAVGVPPGTDAIEVRISDRGGAVVRSFAMRPQGELTDFAWDGRDNQGERLPAGRYRIEAVANVAGRAESVEVLLRQRVDSVSLDGAGSALRLNTSGGSVALGDVRRIM